MPIMGQLTRTIQARYLIAFGWFCLAVAMYYSTQRIDLTISFSAAAWLRVAQVIGMGFLFVPITLVAYIGIPAEKNNAVAGIVNFMRNIGSSVGTSLVTTLIARRSQYHQEILGGYARADSANFQNSMIGLTRQLAQSGLSAHDAKAHAYALIYQNVQAQAGTLAYVDTFMVLAIGSGIMFFLAFILRSNNPRAGGEIAAG
jgi:DHA2 family multidrug resistance protein